MAAKKQDDSKADKVYTAEEFKRLNSKAASLRKGLDVDRNTADQLTTEIKHKTAVRTTSDPSNKDALIQKSTPLRPAEIATRRAQRSQLLLRIASTTAELKTVEKEIRMAAKQISRDSNQGAAVARAKFSVSKNPNVYFGKLIKKLAQNGDGKMGIVMRQFRKEWAKDPAAIRNEMMEMIAKHSPIVHRLLLENPAFEQMVFNLLLGEDTENKK